VEEQEWALQLMEYQVVQVEVEDSMQVQAEQETHHQ
jgi:hypothetical protein